MDKAQIKMGFIIEKGQGAPSCNISHVSKSTWFLNFNGFMGGDGNQRATFGPDGCCVETVCFLLLAL